MLFKSYACNLNINMALHLFLPFPAFKRILGDIHQLVALLLRFHMFAWWKNYSVFKQFSSGQTSFLDLNLLFQCFLC